MDEKEFLDAQRQSIEHAIEFFSNRSKKERELWVVRRFLQTLGISFDESELKASDCDPPDVLFQGLSFEVKEEMDPGRRRHDEYREALLKVNQANSVRELLRREIPRVLSYDEIASHAIKKASTLVKNRKYPVAVRKTLDLLVYANLDAVYGYRESPLPPCDGLIGQGWRSVSFLSGDIASVLSASASCSQLLADFEGKVLRHPDSSAEDDMRLD